MKTQMFFSPNIQKSYFEKSLKSRVRRAHLKNINIF